MTIRNFDIHIYKGYTMIRAQTLELINTDAKHIIQKEPGYADFNMHQTADLLISSANSLKQLAVSFMQGMAENDENKIRDAILTFHNGLATLAAISGLYMDKIEDACARENKTIITSYTSDGKKMVNLMAKK